MRTRHWTLALLLGCIVAGFAVYDHQSQDQDGEPSADETNQPSELSPSPQTQPLPSQRSVPGSDLASSPDPIHESFKSALKDMQKADELATASAAALHHTPEATLAAARRLGEIVELEAKQPGRQNEFLEFYRGCAEDELVITVTRAQCAKEYLRASQVDQDAAKSWLQALPEAVQRIHSILEP